MSRVLIFDPSGNHGGEGAGTTGYAVFVDGEVVHFGTIASKDFLSQEMYWGTHTDIIAIQKPDTVVMESYKLFAHKSKQQHWSTLDTPQLIGYMRMWCWKRQIPVVFQDPGDKVRVTDPILVKQGIFEKRGNKHYCMGRSTVLHERDAIRHGIYFHKYGKGRV